MRFFIILAIVAIGTLALNDREKRSAGGQYQYNDYQIQQQRAQQEQLLAQQLLAQQQRAQQLAQQQQSQNEHPQSRKAAPNQPDDIPAKTSGQLKYIYFLYMNFCSY